MYCMAYVPVIHEGYLRFFKRALEAGYSTLLLVDPKLAESISGANRDFAVDTTSIQKMIVSLALFEDVLILNTKSLSLLHAGKGAQILANKHVLTEHVIHERLPQAQVVWDTTFLRWDMPRALSEVPVDGVTISTSEIDRRFMQLAVEESQHSSDPWRQVGVVAVRDGKILAASFNTHMPTPESNYLEGDPATWREAGRDQHISRGFHAERRLISEVAKDASAALKGSDFYVTTFPCFECVMSIIGAGVGRVFFRDGHSNLDGLEALQLNGIEVIRVPQ